MEKERRGQEMDKVIITVVGKDTVGIIAKVCTQATASFEEIYTRLETLGEEIGVKIHCQREEIFTKMHRI